MRQQSIDAFQAVLAEVEAVHGAPRIVTPDPQWRSTDDGQVERLSMVVFIGGRNHGCGIDEPTCHGGRTVIRAWGHGNPVDDITIRTVTPTVSLLRDAAIMVGLLPPRPVEPQPEDSAPAQPRKRIPS